jgi:hypothetical protein
MEDKYRAGGENEVDQHGIMVLKMRNFLIPTSASDYS